MATISNSAGAAPVAPAPASGTAATAGAQGTSGSSGTASDVFTQLISSMISAGGSPAPHSTAPVSEHLAALVMSPEALQSLSMPPEELDALLGGLPDGDTDTDTESGEEGAPDLLGLSVLLAGLQSLPPKTQPPAALGSAGSSAGTRGDASLGALSFDVGAANGDATRAALEALTSSSTFDAAGDLAAAIDADSSGAVTTASPQNAANPAQLHAMLAAHSTRNAEAIPDPTLRAPLGTPAWKDELGTQLTWMAVNGREAASLRLSPEHLGPLEIRISTREGEASVQFSAANADTRNALEQSLPRLRELFAAQGMVLTDAGVSRDAPQNAFKQPAPTNGSRDSSDALSEPTVKSVTLGRLGLVDTYV